MKLRLVQIRQNEFHLMTVIFTFSVITVSVFSAISEISNSSVLTVSMTALQEMQHKQEELNNFMLSDSQIMK